MITIITRPVAAQWLALHDKDFAAAGFRVEIVGSVAQAGSSAHDLDLLLTSVEPRNLEAALGAFYEKIAPVLALSEVASTPLEAGGLEGVWFVGSTSPQGWLVEFYFEDPS